MNKDFDSTLTKIKSRGHWKIQIYPATIKEKILGEVIKGKEIIRNCAVELRGWDYPHFPTSTQEHQDLYVAGDKVEAWIDMEQFKEVWRFYQNGQFVHLFGLREDWWQEDKWLSEDHPLKKINPGEVLEVVSTTYSLTEIYAFLNNFVNSLDISEINVEIGLYKTKGRVLHLSDPGRMPLFSGYKSRIDEINLPKQTYTKEQITETFLDLAFDQIIYLFHQFNWDNPPLEVIKEDQKKLIERRI